MCTAQRVISSSRSSAYSTTVRKTMSYSATTPFISGHPSATRNMRYFSATAATSTASVCPLPCTPEPILIDCGSPDFRGFFFSLPFPVMPLTVTLTIRFWSTFVPLGVLAIFAGFRYTYGVLGRKRKSRFDCGACKYKSGRSP